MVNIKTNTDTNKQIQTQTNKYRHKQTNTDTNKGNVSKENKHRHKQKKVQFSSRWYLCAQKIPYALHPVSQKFPQCSNVRLIDDGPLSSFQGRSSSASAFITSLLQAINGVISLALYPQLVSVSSSSTYSEKQATCFARQSMCSVISHHYGMSRAVHPLKSSKVDVDH